MASERGATRGRGKTRRAVLLTIMALGAVVSLSAVSGVFAIFTDRATTGQNSASSRAEARSADLQIATASFDPGQQITTCGEYDEDLVTGIITVSDLIPGGFNFAAESLCLTNVGSRSLDVSASVIDLVDTDHACTGDEAALDETCGGDATGELSTELHVVFVRSCVSPLEAVGERRISALTSTPLALGTLAPGDVTCVRVVLDDMAQTTGDTITISQSDTSTWRFAFDGTAV